MEKTKSNQDANLVKKGDMLRKYSRINGKLLEYQFDADGNIMTVSSDNYHEAYYYDEEGLLEKCVKIVKKENVSIVEGMTIPVDLLSTVFNYKNGKLVSSFSKLEVTGYNENYDPEMYHGNTDARIVLTSKKIYNVDEHGLHSIDDNFTEEWYDEKMNVIRCKSNWNTSYQSQFPNYPGWARRRPCKK